MYNSQKRAKLMGFKNLNEKDLISYQGHYIWINRAPESYFEMTVRKLFVCGFFFYPYQLLYIKRENIFLKELGGKETSIAFSQFAMIFGASQLANEIILVRNGYLSTDDLLKKKIENLKLAKG